MDSPIKWHGGKHYLTDWLWSHAPDRGTYTTVVDGCFGSGAFLLGGPDPQGKSEIGNDINGEVINFFRVLATPSLRTMFIEAVNLLPVHELASEVFASQPTDIPRAVAFYTRIRQSFSGQGKTFAPPSRNRTRGGRNEQVNTWLNGIDKLPEIAHRLRNVYWYMRPIVDIIKNEATHPATFLYIDPPYHPDTRKTPEVYDHEMTAHDHQVMLTHLTSPRVHAKVMISGYRCLLYDTMLKDWRRYDYHTDNKVSPTREPVIESIWCNYA